MSSSTTHPLDPDTASQAVRGFRPQRFRLADENQEGVLTIGSKRFPIRVTEMSAFEFIVIGDAKALKKVLVKKFVRLQVLDVDCRAQVMAKKQLGENRVILELYQVEEAYQPRLPSRSFFSSDATVRLSSGDALLPILCFAALIVTILCVPSLGGRWGASQRISESVERGWKTVKTTFSR